MAAPFITAPYTVASPYDRPSQRMRLKNYFPYMQRQSGDSYTNVRVIASLTFRDSLETATLMCIHYVQRQSGDSHTNVRP